MAPLQAHMVALVLAIGCQVSSAFIDRLVPKDHTHKCMDLDRGDTSNGNRLVLWDCWDTSSQKFLLGDHIVYKEDITKCVDYVGTSPANGNHLQIWDCKDLHYHKWAYNFDDSSIRLAIGGGQELCLQREWEKTDNGNPLIIWECNGHESQQWALADDKGNFYTGDERNLEYIIPIVVLSVLLSASIVYNGCQRRWRKQSSQAAQSNAASDKDLSGIGRQHEHLEETTSEQSAQV